MSDSTGLPLIETSVASTLCPDTASLCSNLSKHFCYNGGTCCTKSGFDFCACLNGYEDDDCSLESLFNDLMESRDNSMRLMGLSSVISIFVGLIALVALGIIIFIVVRKSGQWRFWSKVPAHTEDLDETIVYVQEEISKLSTVQQLTKLHRLSRLFEKTVREAILSESEDQVEPAKGEAMNEYLPRWSSAPTCINRPPNDLDMPDGDDDVFRKPKLQQVFSLQ